MRLVLLTALLAAAPAAAADRAFPTGGAFDRVSNSTPFDVYVHTGKAPGVHASGTDEALDRLQIENRGGNLHIGTTPGSWFSNWHWGKGQKLRVDVTVPMVSEVNLSGPGNLTIDAVRSRDFGAHLSGPGDINVGAVEASGVTLTLSGPGDITIAGHADRAVLNLSGPGDLRAGRFSVADASVTLSGPGDITANVTRNADVRLSGPGDVTLTGGAHCSIHKSGPGDVHCG